MTTMSNARRGLPLTSSRIEKIFPKLTPAQIDRLSRHGRIRSVQAGGVLIEEGDTSVPLFDQCNSGSSSSQIEPGSDVAIFQIIMRS